MKIGILDHITRFVLFFGSKAVSAIVGECYRSDKAAMNLLCCASESLVTGHFSQS